LSDVERQMSHSPRKLKKKDFVTTGTICTCRSTQYCFL